MIIKNRDEILSYGDREGREIALDILEAGLAGIPIVCTDVPAGNEIGGRDVVTFDLQDTSRTSPAVCEGSSCRTSQHRLRRRVRQRYTWQAIIERDIKPLIDRQEKNATHT